MAERSYLGVKLLLFFLVVQLLSITGVFYFLESSVLHVNPPPATVPTTVTKFVDVPCPAESPRGEAPRPVETPVSSDDATPILEYLLVKYRAVASEVKRLNAMRKEAAEKAAGVAVSAPAKPAFELYGNVPASCDAKLKVATYNIWNINQPWEKRRDTIISEIQRADPDLIGFQEIRLFNGRNQLDELQSLMPQYPHKLYEMLHTEQPQDGSEEGMGVLSKYPIVRRHREDIHPAPGPRAIIGVTVNGTEIGAVSFFVTHLPVYDFGQCKSIVRALDYLHSLPMDVPQILVGDMNTYFDFEWPLDYLIRPYSPFFTHDYNPCAPAFREHRNARKAMEAAAGEAIFADAWEDVFPHPPWGPGADPALEHRWWGAPAANPGLTFTNFFADARTSDYTRADRILLRTTDASGHMVTCHVGVLGAAPVSVDAPTVFPSDHRGVAAAIAWDTREGVSRAMRLAPYRPQPAVGGARPVARPKIVNLARPNCRMQTALPAHGDSHVNQAFDGDPETFFWAAQAVRKDDTVSLIFDNPMSVASIRVVTGTRTGADMLESGTLEASIDGTQFAFVAAVDDTGVAQGTWTGELRVIRLRATADQTSWLVVREFIIS